MAVCMLPNQSNSDYHSDPALGATYWKTLIGQSPLHAECGVKTINPYVADFGTAVHLIFEERSDKVFKGPETRRGAKWLEAKANAEKVGGVALPIKDYDSAIRAGSVARSHTFAHRCFNYSDGVAEQSIYVTHPNGTKLKCRPDYFIPSQGILLDLKTTVSASPEDFTKSFFRMNYDLQAGTYTLVCELAGFTIKEFHFLAVEKTEPFACQHFKVGEDILDAAKERVGKAISVHPLRKKWGFHTGWPLVSEISNSTQRGIPYGI